MNKTAIKNFAIWARNKLIADVCYRAGLVGITEKGIQDALPQSDNTTEFYDIGIATPYAVSGQAAIRQRRNLAEAIRRRAADSDYPTAYRCIMEEVAYTWFNRLIAVRFMEVNDYLPGRVRVLSSESGKIEPDLVTNPFDAELSFSAEEEQTILQMKQDNKLDELFRLLFIKQCNALAAVLPALFEQTEDYTELLLNLSVVDQEGVVWHLTHDIPEDDFNVEKGGQVEIIGWLYQYYNTEPKAQVFARPSGQKIKKEEIPAATQLFTPDWIVRYMVENSLGRLWLEYCPPGMACGNGEDALRELWAYYIDEAEQEPNVEEELKELRQQYLLSDPTQIKLIDPCMGSGHILVYAFEVLFQIYYSRGYSERDIPALILQHNLYGLDIDKRAYQLAYFAVMMKARQYDRRFLTRGIEPNIYEIQASSGKYPYEMGNFLLSKEHQETLNYLLEVFQDAKEYGSLLKLEQRDYAGLLEAWQNNAQATAENVNMVLWYSAVEEIVPALIKQAIVLTQKYDVVVTNPPYMGGAGMGGRLAGFVKENYPDSKSDLSTAFMEQTIRLCSEHGYMSMINIPVWMFLSSYEKLREKMIKCNTFINMVHPGRGIFGSDFGTTTFVIQKAHVPGYIGSYRRLFEKQGEVESVEERERAFLAGKGSFTAQQDNFSKIPGSPVAYWVSRDFIAIFSHKDSIGDFCYPRQGLHTGNNEKYLRFWYEVCGSEIMFAESEMWDSKAAWAKLNKGGNYRKWYGNREYIIFWKDNGLSIKTNGHSVGASNKTFLQNMIGFTDITSYKASFRFYGKGFVYDVSGPAMFNTENVVSNNFLLGLLNSKICDEVMLILSPTIHMNQTALSKVSVIHTNISKVEELVQECITISKTDWDSFETSWDFKRHPLV